MVRELSSEKREKFLNSALKLFVANGVQNTSTAQIAKEAGTAAGTLFLYFPTKQALLDELILKIGRQQADLINSQLDPSASAREIFFMIWNNSVHWFLENMDAFCYVQQVRDSGMISETAVRESDQFFSFYYVAIQKGLQEGSIQPYPLDLVGGFLYQDIVAIINHIRMQPDPGNLDETIQHGFDIFWNGIKSAPHQAS